MRLQVFLKYIIKCSTKDNAPSDFLHHACFDMYKANTTEDFTTQLKENSEVIAKKVQIYSLIHNPTYDEYNMGQSKVCGFSFLRFKIQASNIDHH